MKTDEIRSKYIQFFADRGARVVPSDSLVPANDPTLLFTGAGMNQFKDYFLGIGKMDFRRATSSQKCIRTGDIMNVGVTAGHHTFFEMLGNFSFGDYFKEEAIAWAWEFLIGVLKIPERRLRISVYHSDDEAFDIWHQKVGLASDRITRLGDHDNFWPADAPKLGPNGPCGPCSEIFYDRGEAYGPDLGITEGQRWVEIWNLVFTQFDRQSDGSLPPLPQKNIDTGAGLERMAACLQGVRNNMEIDIFQPLLAKVEEMCGRKYSSEGADGVLFRRVSDHARAVTFCIADGVMPANSHRGYVLKRLLRRAVLDGRNLGIKGAFLHKLVPVVGQVMGRQYPEIIERAETISRAVVNEEDKFLSTLEKGLTLIDTAVRKTRDSGKAVLDGATAFELYDTYGFPYELAEEVVEKEKMIIDREGFDEAMSAAKAKAREGAKMKGDVFAKGPVSEVKKLTGETVFAGYDQNEISAKVIALVKGGELVQTAASGEEITVVLDRTTFYGESGGQVGDSGILVGANNLVVEIDDTLKIDSIHFHIGRIESGKINVGMEINCQIDSARREDIRRNHTVTHLLHHALHQVVGNKAEQKGSYVAPDRMRFDYQHGQALTADQRARVEEVVNQKILENAKVETQVLPIEEAKKIGAIALFGEKYGATVRVVKTGDYSVEFCGGTHMNETGPIGSFRILAEESVSAGVRRIEAVTGAAAYRYSHQQGEILTALSHELKVAPKELSSRVAALGEEVRALRKELAAIKQEQTKNQLGDLQPQKVGNISYVALNLGNVMGKELAAAADIVKNRLGDDAVTVLAGTDGEKVAIVVAVGKNLAPKTLKAGDIIRKLAEIVGGGGGGRPDLAQAGGKNPEKIEEMLAAVPQIISA
jgi:alanyl-tRNA synthetase